MTNHQVLARVRSVAGIGVLALAAAGCDSSGGAGATRPLPAVGGAGGAGGAVSSGGAGGAVGPGGAGGAVGPGGAGGAAAVDNRPYGDYETVLRLSLRFYGAQRSGETANWLLHEGGETGCFDGDGQALPGGARDLTGGWHDAGDHIKPTLTNVWASMLLLKAYEAFPAAFDDLYGPTDPMGASGDVRGTPNGIPDVLDEVKFAVDFLAKTYIDSTTLVLQVGDANTDHSGDFNPCPQQDDREVADGGEMSGASVVGRVVYTGRNGHAGGLAAAALAMMSRLYAPFDAAAAATYRTAAVNIYAAALPTAAGGAAPAPYAGGKPEVGMLCGAAELYRATGQQSYLDDSTALSLQVGQHGYVAGFDNPHEFCQQSWYLAGREASQPNSGKGKWLSNLQTQTTSGLIYQPAWSNWGVLRYATTAAFSAVLFDAVGGTHSNEAVAFDQLDWVMGTNPGNTFGHSFICGYGNGSPQHPHHRNANWNGAAYTLYGGLVGGAPPGSTYSDTTMDFRTNEVAIDYNAGLVGLAAFAVNRGRAASGAGGAGG